MDGSSVECYRGLVGLSELDENVVVVEAVVVRTSDLRSVVI